MATALPRAVGRLPHPVLTGLAVALCPAVGLALAAQGRVLLHQCLPAGGLGPWGVGLAVLRDASECPDGSYALGSVASGAVVLLSVAVPVLVAHLLAALCGVGLSAAVLGALRAVPRFLRTLVRRTVDEPAAVVVRGARMRVAAVPVRPHARLLVVHLPVRGPPAVV
ncbi:hypothetical protein Cch01nite_32760 [Cellulomonas chitinilytica]|uniref:Uncharacterized protein n=1 Tax=Cellulomonas chitinilytica TaxID=398759 RepID=A0A919U3L3_9CELL|nr:hypothetical protein Cch01nite_32760 [Cellulomonas chitinilytica]